MWTQKQTTYPWIDFRDGKLGCKICSSDGLPVRIAQYLLFGITHFHYAMTVEKRSANDKKLYGGLLKRQTLKQFLLDLALMYDAMSELALLSECLQKRATAVTYADKLILHSIRFIIGHGERPGTKVLAPEEAISQGKLGTVVLTDNSNIVTINRQQFLQSLSNNLSNRMFATASLHGTASQAPSQSTSDFVQLLTQLKVLEREN